MSVKKEDRILEAIDQLRRRKARPDADRICNFLLRRFNIAKAEALLLLNSLLTCDPPKVLKVIYKGFTSYRRPNALKAKSQADFSVILASALSELIVEEPDYLDFGVPPDEFEKFLIAKDKIKFTKRNVNAIIQAEIDKGNLVSLETGNLSLVDSNSSTLESMENSPFKSCSSSSNNSTPTKNVPQQIATNSQSGTQGMDEIVRDIIFGTDKADRKSKKSIINTKKTKINDRKRKMVEDKSKTSTEDSEPKSKEVKLESEGFRDGVRRKRAAKKVFDPSDAGAAPQLASRKRGRPLAGKKSDAPVSNGARPADDDLAGVFGKPKGGVCCVCHSLGSAEKLVTCRDCSNRAHPSCTERKYDACNPSAWQCLHCKTCCVCCETDEYAPMIVCSLCDDGYHFSCHMPPVAYKPKVAWVCIKCLDAAAKMKSESNLAGCQVQASPAPSAVKAIPSPAPSPPASPVAAAAPSSSSGVSSGGSSDNSGDVDPRVPDASGWSVDQVADYLVQRGYCEQAAAFRDNEIDGMSLLLMKRSDVLGGLQLKLGPALKAYKQVKRLQIRRSELHLLWA